ncbi:MAG: BlaI/MecI/CopY family transcriptional regulator [Myxococcales bacterium]|nr:BlaI/MecI/CopY family transcriptional regulator [Myxococcales bacterium]
MDSETPPRPTDAEIAILRVLWARGAATVREVHEALKGERGTGYTTVLKLMQIMTEKGLVERDVSRRSHVYRARVGETETQDQLVDDLVLKAFGGSATRLVMRALKTAETSREELESLRSLLNSLARARDGEEA